ncbi:MAG: hypothetical protein U9R42_06475 [Bacteroidota bacterium]|nr:hypothetical protein [Bacteroidota bacterium]
MKEYFKIPKTKAMSNLRDQLRKLDDEIWKNYIFSHLFQYYNSVDNKTIQTIIQKETDKKKANIETEIKKHIRNWLTRQSESFDEQEFIVNLEPSSECNKDGFIDLKFEHSSWRNKYFSFEAKNLGEIKNRGQSTLINEYVYVKTKDREDGGMYRYMTNKYACELNFGGMLGFVVGKNQDLINKLTDKIQSVYQKTNRGTLIGNKIIYNSITDNKNTFDTIHLRKNSITKQEEKFCLHHIIMDFANCDE